MSSCTHRSPDILIPPGFLVIHKMDAFDKLDLSSLDLEFLEEFQASDDDEDGDPLLTQSTKGSREHVRKIWYRSVSSFVHGGQKASVVSCSPYLIGALQILDGCKEGPGKDLDRLVPAKGGCARHETL